MKQLILILNVALVSTPIVNAGGRPKIKNCRALDSNNWKKYLPDYGPYVFPVNNSHIGYWGGPSYNYIYGVGFCVV